MKFIVCANDGDPPLAELGGKAKALAILAQQNLPIPDWIVLSPRAFDYSLTDEQRDRLRRGELQELEQLFKEVKLNPAIQTELEAAVKQLCPTGELLAVRSSAVDEDGSQHSFAGQLESYLFVPPAEVADRVLDVWKSGFSDRLLAYRREHHLSPLPQPPAVLIQHMVTAAVAGVAFSANPVTGQRGIAVISAVQGSGTSLVSGEADADTYHIDRTGAIVQRHLTQSIPILTDAQVQAIASLVRQVERQFERPQDIEWAIADDHLYLLQARPITTLTHLPDPDALLNLWDNSNIAESYGGITTPLTYSFARRAYEEVYRQFCRLMGVSEAAIAHHAPTFRCMIGLIQGRIYYNLLNWYRVLALLPGFTVNRRFMEQMMGVREELPPEVLASLQTASLTAKLQDGLRLGRTLLGLVQNYLTLPRQIDRFYQRLNRALSLSLTDLEGMRLDELATHYTNLERQLLTRWDAPLVNDFFAMIFYGVLRKLVTAWCGDTDGTLQNDLIRGEGGMISAEPAQRVRQMAAGIQGDRSFIDCLCNGSLQQIRQAMVHQPAFRQHYQEYLDKFGDRCLEELKLESATLHDDPLPLLRSIGYVARQTTPSRVDSLPDSQTSLPATLSGWRRLLFNWVLHNTRRRVRDRENLRFERTRLFGRVRRIFLEIGRRLYALDILNYPRDIFYLNLDEILGFIDGTTTCTDLKGLITVRQAEFNRYPTLPNPGDRLQTHGSLHPFHPLQNPKSKIQNSKSTPPPNSLHGTGCCPGIVRAPVQVITDPKTAQLRQGSILVAERTDPGWIMLFPAASGLLVERGSLLSHSAIVAREMGIPAIVSIPGITHWLQDGDWVEMDGTTGTVQRLPLTPNS